MSSSAVSLRLATEPVVFATLEQIAREGARRALQKAIEDEVAEYVNAHRDHLDETGHRMVVRNGVKPAREILSALGPIEVKQPRVNDRRVDENGVRFRFTSKILPPYLRKTASIEDLVPWLYLKGISTGEMSDALVHLGFDGAGLSATSVVRMAKILPSTRQQRCWVHKTANVLDKLPKSQQKAAKGHLHEIWMSATKDDATQAFDRFIATYGVKWPRSAECLEKDRAELLVFYDFPAEHWGHLRTSNPIESTFATVRLRTYRTKGAGSRLAALAMAFKLARKAEKGWRRLNKSEKLREVFDGIVFVDGLKKAA